MPTAERGLEGAHPARARAIGRVVGKGAGREQVVAHGAGFAVGKTGLFQPRKPAEKPMPSRKTSRLLDRAAPVPLPRVAWMRRGSGASRETASAWLANQCQQVNK